MSSTIWLWLTVRHGNSPTINGGSFAGKIIYFLWAIFHGELLNNQMVYNFGPMGSRPPKLVLEAQHVSGSIQHFTIAFAIGIMWLPIQTHWLYILQKITTRWCTILHCPNIMQFPIPGYQHGIEKYPHFMTWRTSPVFSMSFAPLVISHSCEHGPFIKIIYRWFTYHSHGNFTWQRITRGILGYTIFQNWLIHILP